ncbi:MAG: ABC transporter permease [Rhodanobacteraceae bacterium]|nr:ABC transporter permease [Rhodanobacteraceae bacterium]
MLTHYVKVALRNLVRDRIYSSINLVSLALAIACAVVLTLYVANELTYDTQHAKRGSIVRVVNEISTNGQPGSYAMTSRALGPLLLKAYPQIGNYVRVRNLAVARNVFRYQDKALYWDKVRIADENLFDVFTHEALYGDLKTALSDPSSIAVSETFARAYFGDRNPVGETVSTDTFSYRIAAVFKDLPKNTHLRYDAVLSMKRLRAFGIDDISVTPEQLFGLDNYTYFELAPGMDRATFDQLLARFRDEVALPAGRDLHSRIEFFSQPLTAIHFDNAYRYDNPTGSLLYVYGFIAIGLFLIGVACINYTNLATARAVRRAKEIGMRRVLGATPLQLVAQFLGESICFALLAALLALAMLAAFNATVGIGNLLGTDVELSLFRAPAMWLGIFFGVLLIGVVAGAYPAFYLSAISPKAAITHQRSMRKSSFGFREALVLVQLVVSIGIVSGTLIMNRQMDYVANMPLGFDSAGRIALLLRGVDVIEKIPVMKAELERRPDVLGVAESSFAPGDEVNATLLNLETNDGAMQGVTVNQIAVGRDFVKVVGLQVVQGRDFSQRMLTDVGASVLVNEFLVRTMGWKDPIGKRIQGDSRVIGVVKDFNFSSLHTPVGPIILHQFAKDDLANVPPVQRNLVARSLVVALKAGAGPEALSAVRNVVSTLDPKHPFEYAFFDDLLRRQYAGEARTLRLTSGFAVICIVISCLGLFGLAAFTTEQRTKEIGMRKVLGASVFNIVLMLSKGLLALVLVAAVLASGATFVVMQYWLATFAYRTEIQAAAFVAASLLIGVLAFLSVAAQAGRTALKNPVKSLRYE